MSDELVIQHGLVGIFSSVLRRNKQELIKKMLVKMVSSQTVNNRVGHGEMDGQKGDPVNLHRPP